MIYGYYRYFNKEDELFYKNILISKKVSEDRIYKDFHDSMSGFLQLIHNTEENDIVVIIGLEQTIHPRLLSQAIDLINSKSLIVFFR